MEVAKPKLTKFVKCSVLRKNYRLLKKDADKNKFSISDQIAEYQNIYHNFERIQSK